MNDAVQLKQPLVDPENQGGNESNAYAFVLVFPLPTETTEEEEANFKKKFLHGGRTHRDLLAEMVINPSADVKIDCDSLKGMRNATIELFATFIQSFERADHDFKIFAFTSQDNDELFLCIKVGDSSAEQWADAGEYLLQLSEEGVCKLVKLSDLKNLVPAYTVFDFFQKEGGFLQLYDVPARPGQKRILREIDIIRLLYDKITDYIKLEELKRLGLVLHAYPHHNATSCKRLLQDWATLSKCWHIFQPIDDVRDYFGEKVAFYFLFVQHLAMCQAVFMIVAIPVGIVHQVTGEETMMNDLIQACYSFALVVWYIIWLKTWRRRSNYYLNKWGMDRPRNDSEIKERVNPDFEFTMKPDPLNEARMTPQADERRRAIGNVVSVVVTVFVMGLIICSIICNQEIANMCDDQDPPYMLFGKIRAKSVASIMLSVQIYFWDTVWDYLAEWLTKLEQHPTQLEYDDAKSNKTFIMSFVNTFFSFIYMVLAENNVYQADPKALNGRTPQAVLASSLLITYIFYVSFGILDMLIPFVTLRLAIWSENRALRKKGGESQKLSLFEQESKMLSYTGPDEAADYIQVIFPWAILLMFSMVSPLWTNLLALVAILTQIRCDAKKLTVLYQRVFPDIAQKGIGVWDGVLNYFAYCGIVVNIMEVLLVLKFETFCELLPKHSEQYCSSRFESDPIAARLLVGCIFLLILVSFKFSFEYLVPDMPARTQLSVARQEVQRAELFRKEQEALQESVFIHGSGKVEVDRFNEIPPLGEGSPMFTLPLLQ